MAAKKPNPFAKMKGKPAKGDPKAQKGFIPFGKKPAKKGGRSK